MIKIKYFLWEFDFFVKNAIFGIKSDLIFDKKKLLNEFLLIESKFSKELHPDIYHNGGWSAIPLRSKKGDVHIRFSGGQGKYLWSDISKFAPYTKKICASVGSNLLRVRYLTLEPGYKVFWHIDSEESFDSEFIRFHIPLVTNIKAFMWIANKRFNIPFGELWCFDFGFPHRLANKGNFRRTHLVFDIKKNSINNLKLLQKINLAASKNLYAKNKCAFYYQKTFNQFFIFKFYIRVIKNKVLKFISRVFLDKY